MDFAPLRRPDAPAGGNEAPGVDGVPTNTLYYGDNLDILRQYIPDESVDLIYLDPPYNSKRDYNILFKDESGLQNDAQIVAFDDTWHWGPKSERSLAYLTTTARHRGAVPSTVSVLISALVSGLGKNQMLAYLVEMTIRLVELHRVLKPTGSIYLHCDPTASHYLKIIMDAIFEPRNFQNEVIWWYRKWSKSTNHFLRNHDVLLFYSKSPEHTFNILRVPLSPSTLKRFGGKVQAFADEARTRKITLDDDSEGGFRPDVWSINLIPGASAERLGYQTQKPRALLRIVIEASSNPGDVVLDPFCGCGTTIAAAQELGRNWIGIDITNLAINLIKRSLTDMFGAGVAYNVIGEPVSVADAKALATSDPYQFQWWALDLVGAMPVGGVKKKGKDRGIDGMITFPDRLGKMESVVVSVKSGNVNPGMVRDLRGVVERDRAAVGIFLTLQKSTAEMRLEAAKAGDFTDAGGRDWPRIQILTIDDLLNQGRAPKLPAYVLPPYQRASRVPVAVGVEQASMFDGDGHPIEEPPVPYRAPVARHAEDSVASGEDTETPPKRSRGRRRSSAAS